jgi:acetyl-CoA carboxylase carboxyltransferase component
VKAFRLGQALGATMQGVAIQLSGAAAVESLKGPAAEARRWIDEAIAMAAKRPDLGNTLEALQRSQQDLEKILTGKGLPRT